MKLLRNEKVDLFIYDKEKYFFGIVYDPLRHYLAFTGSVIEIF